MIEIVKHFLGKLYKIANTVEKLRKNAQKFIFIALIKLITIDEMGVDELGVDEMGVDEMGSRQSGNKPLVCWSSQFLINKRAAILEIGLNIVSLYIIAFNLICLFIL